MGIITIQSASRPDITYEMVVLPEGLAVHLGLGCEAETFRGPLKCHHSKELSEEKAMTQALVPQNHQLQQIQFSESEMDTLKKTICKDASTNEMLLFVTTCQTLGLNPFNEEIYLIPYNNVKKPQVGVAGYRKRAADTGSYAGQDGPYWSKDGKEWVDVWTSKEPPAYARVTIYRSDFKVPIVSTVRWEAYGAQRKTNALWATRGPEMLAKNAEIHGFRRAFPRQTADLDAVGSIEAAPMDVETPQEPRTALSQPAKPQPDAQDGEFREMGTEEGSPPWDEEPKEELPGWEETEEALRAARPGRRSDDYDVLPIPDNVRKEPQPSDEPPMTIDQARAYVRNTLKEFHKSNPGDKYAELCRAIVNIAPGMRKDGKISAAAMTEHKAKEVIEVIRKFTEPVVLDPEHPTCCPNASGETIAFTADGDLVCKACGTIYPA